jgi:drug/metabolite transporter (DMT)-like permease
MVTNAAVVSDGTDHAHHRLAVMLVLVSSTINSAGGLLLRSIDVAGPWHVLFYRQGALALALILVLALRHRGRIVLEFIGIGRHGVLAGMAMGAGATCYILSLSNTMVANTLFILSATPFVTAVLAWVWLKEPVRRNTWIAMALALVGIAIMVGGGFAAGSVFGNVMALITVLCFSCFVVLLRRGRATNMLAAVVFGASIASINAAIILKGDFAISLHDLVICLAWGGGLSTFVHFLFVWSSRFVRGAELMLLVLVEFILGPLWVWIFVAEVPRTATLIGGAVVLVTVASHALLSLRGEKATTAGTMTE